LRSGASAALLLIDRPKALGRLVSDTVPALKNDGLHHYLISTGSIPPHIAIPSGVLLPRINMQFPVGQRIYVQRPRDLVNLCLEWHNVDFSIHGDRSYLRVPDPNQDSFLVLHFPPQHCLEKAFPEDAAVTLPVPTRFAGPTRLAFHIPKGSDGRLLPGTFNEIVNWLATLQPSVADCAQPTDFVPPDVYTAPTPKLLVATETSIELPYGLYLSPDSGECWQQGSPPHLEDGPEENGRTELWHLKLVGSPKGDGSGWFTPTVRAVGLNPCDPCDSESDDTFSILPNADDRQLIVIETSDYQLRPSPPPLPGSPGRPLKPVSVDKLLVSALGAYAKLGVSWTYEEVRAMEQLHHDDSPQLKLVDWLQQTIWGRDQLVEVAKLGYVMPFGHPVAFVRTRQREFEIDPGVGADIAVLRRRYFYRVLKPELVYTMPPEGVARVERVNCFHKVRIEPVVTPFADSPVDPYGWIQLETTKELFKFKVIAEDWEGQTHHFEIPLFWVDSSVAELKGDKPEYWADALKKYQSEYPEKNPPRPDGNYCTAAMHGQKLSFVRCSQYPASTRTDEKTKERDTSVQTESIVLEVIDEAARNGLNFPPENEWPIRFHPTVASAAVRLDSAASFSSNPADAATFTFNEIYKLHGFDTQNPKQIYGDIQKASLNFSGSNSGGLCTPSVSIRSLSLIFGPSGFTYVPAAVAPPGGGMVATAAVDAKFQPGEFFAGMEALANLIGGVALKDVVVTIENFAEELSRVPRLVAETVRSFGKSINDINDEFQQIGELLKILSDTSPDTAVRKIQDFLRQKLDERKRMFFDFSTSIQQQLVDEMAITAESVAASIADAALSQLNKIIPSIAPNNLPRLQLFLQAAIQSDAVIQQIRANWRQPDKIKEAIQTEVARALRQELGSQVDVLTDWINNVINEKINTFQQLVVSANDVLANIIADAVAQLDSFIPQARKDDLPRLKAILQAALGGEAIIQEIKAYWDSPAGIQDAVDKAIEISLEDELGDQLAPFEQKIHTSLARHVILLQQSLPRLREWAVAQLILANPLDPKKSDEQLRSESTKLRKAIENLRELFDFGNLLNQLNANIGGAIGLLEELLQFPLMEFQEIQADLARIASDISDPQNKIGDVTAALTDFREALRKIIESPDKRASDLLIGKETTYLSDLKRHVEVQLKIEELTPQGINNSIDALQKQIIDHDKIQDIIWPPSVNEAVTTYLKKDGALAQRLIASVASCQQNIIIFLADLNDAAGVVLTQLQTAMVDIAAALQQALDLVDDLEKKAQQELAELPKEINLEYDWRPRLQDASVFIANRDGQPASFSLNAKVHKGLTPSNPPSPPHVRIEGWLQNFQLKLLPFSPFLLVTFKQVNFVSVDGAKPDVTVQIDKVDFDQALGFVKELASVLSPDAKFLVEPAGSGVRIGYRFDLPSITAGGFNLTHLAIVVALDLPFNGDPVRLTFSLSERHRPFLMSVGILGGGGFLGLTLSSKRVEIIEGSFEFGAMILLDLGVASGSVSVTAGIYFSLSGDDSSLSGFVRASGALSILGLITLCVEFYLGLAYERRGGKTYAVGEAIVHVEIDILFFSVSVDLHYRKEFEGSGSSGGNQQQFASAGHEDMEWALDAVAPADLALCKQYSDFVEGWESYRESFLPSNPTMLSQELAA